MILGWRTSTSMTTPLVLDAVEQAIWTRGRRGGAHLGGAIITPTPSTLGPVLRAPGRGRDPCSSVGTVGDSFDSAQGRPHPPSANRGRRRLIITYCAGLVVSAVPVLFHVVELIGKGEFHSGWDILSSGDLILVAGVLSDGSAFELMRQKTTTGLTENELLIPSGFLRH